ncbi:MAG: hypothetical protein RI947_98 [Candidatus Parcubacteria bacterium]|jgi:elongation factor P--beta-lysine ligase
MKIQTHIDHLDSYRLYLKIIAATREYLNGKKYLEIDLPVLSPALIPESYLEVYETEFRYFDTKKKLYLTPSPELFLKRILAYGELDCYSLGKAFRNSEPESKLHSGEFTMLEFYKMHSSYMDIADELLGLMSHIASKLYGTNHITFQGKNISFAEWERMTVAEAFSRFADIDETDLFDGSRFMEQATKKGYITTGFTYEDVFSQIYSQEIEPNLGVRGYPTLLYDYPKEFAALAALNPDRKTAQRFEFYIGGVELGDCYSELTDPKEQEQRFQGEARKRRETGKSDHPIDKGFLEALKYGLKECAGIAIGFERLAMIFADISSIDALKLISI